MPNYTFEFDGDDGLIQTIVTMPMSELDNFKKENPTWHQVFSPTPQNYRGVGSVKLPNAYKDILKKIKKDYPRSTVNV